jgi:adenine/guanine phosphoribosyltransferase-like PRPP-binding protein
MKHTPQFDEISHFHIALHPEKVRELIPEVKKVLKGVKFEAVAFRGNSGALMAPIVALHLKKTLIMVRKTTEGSHSYKLVEGDKAAKRYIIVDDCIDTGKTARVIQREIKAWSSAECLGVLTMNHVDEVLRTDWMEEEL